MSKFTDKLVEVSAKFANIKLLQTIQRAFMMMLPVTMVGSFASLFKGIDVGGYQAFLTSTGLYNALGTVYTFTVGILAVYVVFLVAYAFPSVYQMKTGGISIGLTAFMCFFIVTPYTAPESTYGAATLTTSWMGATGMFTAIIVAFVTGWIFKFCEDKKIAIHMPEQVPPMISAQFTALIPAVFAAVFFSAVNFAFGLTAIGSLHQAVYSVVSAPLQALGANIFGEWVLTLVCYMMWFFGIHGGMTIMPVQMLLFTSIQYENLAAYQAGADLPHMVTGSYLSFSSGSLPLVVAGLIVCKAVANKSITRMGALPSLFGVDEPMYFGLPMILNPIFFIPWVLIVPSIAVWGTYLLQNLGLLGYATGASAGSFVPFFVSNLVGFGVRGLIWGFVFFAIDVLVYIPFIKAYDAQQLKAEQETAEANK